MSRKPNHICKYSGCTYGKNGTPKAYYACPQCDSTQAWRAMACCIEHYTLYIKEVLEAREATEEDMLPNRTDMTKEEVKELMDKPSAEIEKMTREELKDYIDEDGNLNVAEAVDQINEELDNAKTASKSKKRK